MIELMKVREERKIKEKKVKTNKKTIWNLIWGLIGTVGIEFIFFKWLWSDMFEEYPTASKWFNGFFIVVAGICLLGVIFCIIYHPKFSREAEELKLKEKQLEQEIANQ